MEFNHIKNKPYYVIPAKAGIYTFFYFLRRFRTFFSLPLKKFRNDKQNKPKKKISGGMRFFLIVLIIYFISFLLNFEVTGTAFVNFLQMIWKIIPILMVVFFAMFLVNLYFTEKRTKKYFGRQSGIKGWIYAIISGILISGPPYVLYPFLGELKKHGMKDSLLAVFLYNRNVKIPFIPVMIYYFGLAFTIIISFCIIVFSILNGILVEKFVGQPKNNR